MSSPLRSVTDRLEHTFAQVIGPAEYYEVLNLAHKHMVPGTYAEIGFASGKSTTPVLAGTTVVAIDPQPQEIWPCCGKRRVFPMTSDAFFSSHDLTRELGGRPLDFGFIDGAHLYESALLDFMHLERHSHEETTIFVHDCLPIDEATSGRRQQGQKVWSGDVWKVILALREWRPDLRVDVVDAKPTGLGVIRGLDPTSTVLADHFEEIVRRYDAVTYAELEAGGKRKLLGVIPSDWESVKAKLPPRPYRDQAVTALVLRRDVRVIAWRYPRKWAGAVVRRFGLRRPSAS
jgi:hypothetical protein